ncbi:IQ domain-containing protein C isoform X2 [Salmo trutta]|uniref:IQ domain-containing protein C isoform X2 n=1 Tax=Salmo trutta TaxID=8032 RepID=UPI001130BB40|nr:IQ domain-containing protein C isoform X2 [Salmo trutta]
MEGSEWIFILFQAHARGYLMRKEINCARSEFEDIVRDIDGEVNHLDWKGNIIAIPHFKDDGPSGIFTKKHAEEAPDRGSHPLEQPGEREGAQLMSDRLEPERDDPYSHGQASISRGSSSPSSCPPGGEGETQKGKVGKVPSSGVVWPRTSPIPLKPCSYTGTLWPWRCYGFNKQLPAVKNTCH